MEKQFYSCNFFTDKVFVNHSNIGGNQIGFSSPRLAYIVNGECTCISEDGKIVIRSGDVWSIPAKRGYNSIWKGTPNIEFYLIQYEVDFKSLNVKHFKKIENFDMYEDFKNLYESSNEFERLSLFYKIIGKVYPLIADEKKVNIDTILPALSFLHLNFEKTFKVEYLSSLCSMSQSKFFAEFKKITGLSPIDYKNNLKITKASEMVLSNFTLEEICEKLNYTSPAFLRRQMKKFLNTTPRELKTQDKRYKN